MRFIFASRRPADPARAQLTKLSVISFWAHRPVYKPPVEVSFLFPFLIQVSSTGIQCLLIKSFSVYPLREIPAQNNRPFNNFFQGLSSSKLQKKKKKIWSSLPSHLRLLAFLRPSSPALSLKVKFYFLLLFRGVITDAFILQASPLLSSFCLEKLSLTVIRSPPPSPRGATDGGDIPPCSNVRCAWGEPFFDSSSGRCLCPPIDCAAVKTCPPGSEPFYDWSRRDCNCRRLE